MLLNQIQDGTSFGVKEMSAKNSNVPTKSRTRAKTSFQALCLSVRATASDSSPAAASFNPVVRSLPLALAHNRKAEESCAFGLQATSEADNCASALWLFSSATASLLLRSSC